MVDDDTVEKMVEALKALSMFPKIDDHRARIIVGEILKVLDNKGG